MITKGPLSKSLLWQEYIVEGRSCKEIGERHRRSDWGVLYWLRKYGIPSRSRIASAKMPRKISRQREKVSGAKNYNWRGGRHFSNGYVDISVDGQRQYEHRAVAEQVLGRKLSHSETIHHINGNKADNRPENIMIFPTKGDHVRHHAQSRRKA